MEGVGQPCEMPGDIDHCTGCLPFGQMSSESGASLGARLGIGYRLGRLIPGSESGKKDRDSLRFPGCCEKFRCMLVILVQQRV